MYGLSKKKLRKKNKENKHEKGKLQTNKEKSEEIEFNQIHFWKNYAPFWT